MALTFGTTSRNYVSTLVSPNVVDQRDILEKMLDVTREYTSWVDVMELMGRSKPTVNPEYYHLINEELSVQVTISGTPSDTSSGTDGSRWDVTVSAADYAKVREGELAMAPNKTVGYIKEKKASNVLDIIEVGGEDMALADTNILAVFSNASGEGSDKPSARRYGTSTETNHVQIFKEAYEFTDIEMGSRVEFNYNGQDYYLFKGQAEALSKFKSAISAAFVFGRQSTNNFNDSSPNLSDTSSKTVSTTKGLNQYCEEGISITPTGISLATYATIARQMAKARAPKTYMVLVGTEQRIAHDNMLNALTAAAQFSPNARIQVAGKSLDLGIDEFTLYGRKFMLKDLPLLDHKILSYFTGSAGYENRAFFLPMDEIETIDGGRQPRFMTRYLESAPGPYSADLRYREVHYGNLAPTPNGTESIFGIIYESTQGLHCLGKEHFTVVDLA